MKRICLLIIPILLLAAAVVTAAQYQVITKEAAVRKDKRFFAPVVVRVPYGATVTDQGREGDWLRVRYQGKQGWLHISAVQEQKFQLSKSGQAREATREEVALAGKGFTPEVEKVFRDQNPNLKYNLVDKVQAYKINEKQMQAFIQDGRLNEPGGGQ